MKKLLLLLLFPCFQVAAQDLTGIWRGTFYSTKLESMFGSDNKYEVQIDNAGRVCKGVTYSYQSTVFYGKASLIGMWSPDSRNLIFKEEKLLEYKMEGGDENISMFTCYLEYRKEGNREILEGNYTNTNYKSKKDGGPGGKIYLERVVNSDFKKEDFIIKKEKEDGKNEKDDLKRPVSPPGKSDSSKRPMTVIKPKPATIATKPVVKPKTDLAKKPVITKPIAPPIRKPILAAPKPEEKKETVKSAPAIKTDPIRPAELPRVLKERKNELVQTILTPGPDISIELYDNGEIDGDTISIFQNGRLITARRGLSTVPITIKLKIDEDNPDQEIVMVAENLGTIPPNTALMIVKSGGNRYDLRISSSESKNAVVKFKFQKE